VTVAFAGEATDDVARARGPRSPWRVNAAHGLISSSLVWANTRPVVTTTLANDAGAVTACTDSVCRKMSSSNPAPVITFVNSWLAPQAEARSSGRGSSIVHVTLRVDAARFLVACVCVCVHRPQTADRSAMSAACATACQQLAGESEPLLHHSLVRSFPVLAVRFLVRSRARSRVRPPRSDRRLLSFPRMVIGTLTLAGSGLIFECSLVVRRVAVGQCNDAS